MRKDAWSTMTWRTTSAKIAAPTSTDAKTMKGIPGALVEVTLREITLNLSLRLWAGETSRGIASVIGAAAAEAAPPCAAQELQVCRRGSAGRGNVSPAGASASAPAQPP